MSVTLNDLLSKYAELTNLIYTSTDEASSFVDDLLGDFSGTQSQDITESAVYISNIEPPQDIPVERPLDVPTDLDSNIADLRSRITDLINELPTEDIESGDVLAALNSLTGALDPPEALGEPPVITVGTPPDFDPEALPEAPSIEEQRTPNFAEKESTVVHVEPIVDLTDYFSSLTTWYQESMDFLSSTTVDLQSLSLSDFDIDIDLPDGLKISNDVIESIRASLEDDQAAFARLQTAIDQISVENIAEDTGWNIPQDVRSGLDDTYKADRRGVFDNADKITMYNDVVKALDNDINKGWDMPTGKSYEASMVAQAIYHGTRQKKLAAAFTENAKFMTRKVVAKFINYYKKIKLLSDIYGLNAYMTVQFQEALLDIKKMAYTTYLSQLKANLQNISDKIINYRLILREIGEEGKTIALSAKNKEIEVASTIANIESEKTRIEYLRVQADKYREDINKTIGAIHNQMQKVDLYELYISLFTQRVKLFDAEVTNYNVSTKNELLSSLLFKYDAEFKNYKAKSEYSVIEKGIASLKQYISDLETYYRTSTNQDITDFEVSLANLKADVEKIATKVNNKEYILSIQEGINIADYDVKLDRLREYMAEISKFLTYVLQKGEKNLHSKITALSAYDKAYALYLNRKISNVLQSVRASVSMVDKLFEEL